MYVLSFTMIDFIWFIYFFPVMHSVDIGHILKGLAMIIAGQENPLTISRSKETKEISIKIAKIMKENKFFVKFYSLVPSKWYLKFKFCEIF